MSIQIAVRLPDDVVAYVDSEVAAGAPSRAAVVTRALERERRRQAAEQDVRIYAEEHPDDLDSLAAWSAGQPLDLA